ncbi:MAG: hypothetical protein HKN47_17900, partial [Pirellulaceae bacterium]|nr:hypothetical protein [Pirellulaceae bacterium]
MIQGILKTSRRLSLMGILAATTLASQSAQAENAFLALLAEDTTTPILNTPTPTKLPPAVSPFA